MDIRDLHLKILQERLGEIAGEMTRMHFFAAGSEPLWRPRINAYRCRDRIMICVELAGIERADIELRVEPFRVRVGTRRPAPAPAQALQVLALEIDEGRGAREIHLPEEIVPDRVQAEQRNGLLWIDLPLLSPA